MPIYLKYDGIDGEVTVQGFEKWVEVLSFSWGLTNSGSDAAGGAGAGKASFQDLHVLSTFSAASPKLMLATASGQRIDTAELDFVRSVKDKVQTYLTVKLEEVLVSSYQTAGEGDVPSESVGLNFARFRLDYTPQNPDGSPGVDVPAAWDIEAN